ncbi:hypothetical protein [Mycobacterium noviomagense]|uniref:Alanine and proline rich membrane protein n=1 Tax=Mycobacterium noviomagense TaxID=459858 RepID=A0A7I7PDP9_9MYCO|nr:hypothetical protein [Mycobacterium noviomagense]BBY06743.1 hypothetical protein MNVI_20610 [Mycobacterium noviomagense]
MKRILLVTALAVIGGIAIGAWFRPTPGNKPPPAPAAPTFTSQEVSEAKANVCAAYQKVHHANELGRSLYLGDDQVAKQTVAVGGWLALDSGSRYLTTALVDEPATPPDLAQAVRKLANVYQLLAVDYMADVSHPEIDSARQTEKTVSASIERMCA